MYSHYQLQTILTNIFLVCAAIILGLLGGLVSSTGNFLIIAFVVLFLVGLVLLSQPTILLKLVIFGGLMAAGLVQLYLPQLQVIRWAIAGISAILGCMALIQYYLRSNIKEKPSELPALSWWMFAFLMLTIFTGVVNLQQVGTFAVGFKGYYQVWGLFLALMLIRWPEKLIESIPRMIIWIAFIQVPFAIHQYLVLVPKRIGLGQGIIPEDVIAGTFGASLTGGGANAVLSAFLFIALAILISYWKRGLLTSSRLGISSVILFIPILVNMSKISLLYLVLIAVIIFKEDILKRPAKFIVGGIFTGIFMFMILTTYSYLHPDSKSGTFQELIETTIEDNFGTSVGYGGYELNRWAAITFWAREHYRNGEIVPAIIGHGILEAREAEGGIGLASTIARKRYASMGIGLTAISALLWETGLVGLVLVLGIYLSAYRATANLAEQFQENVQMSAVFQGLHAGVAVLILGLAHKNSFVFHLPYQTLVMLILGYIAYWDLKLKSAI